MSHSWQSVAFLDSFSSNLIEPTRQNLRVWLTEICSRYLIQCIISLSFDFLDLRWKLQHVRPLHVITFQTSSVLDNSSSLLSAMSSCSWGNTNGQTVLIMANHLLRNSKKLTWKQFFGQCGATYYIQTTPQNKQPTDHTIITLTRCPYVLLENAWTERRPKDSLLGFT